MKNPVIDARMPYCRVYDRRNAPSRGRSGTGNGVDVNRGVE